MVELHRIKRLAKEITPEEIVWLIAYMAVDNAREITESMCRDGEAIPSLKQFTDISIDQAFVAFPEAVSDQLGEIDQADRDEYKNDYTKINVVTAIRSLIAMDKSLTTITLSIEKDKQKLGMHDPD